MKRKTFILLFLAISCLVFPKQLFAGDFEKGTELLQSDKASEAAVYFERALIADPTNADIYFRLATAYEMTGQNDRAISTLKSSLDRGLGQDYVLYANIGNNYVRKGQFAEAIQYFTQSINKNSAFSEPVLNRAGAYLRNGDFPNAITDYQHFLDIDPNNAKSPDVIRMIAALKGEVVAQEQRKADAEKQKALEEAQKIADAEKQKAAEEQKRKDDEQRKQMLDNIFNTLTDSSTDANSLSAGTEGVKTQTDDLSRE